MTVPANVPPEVVKPVDSLLVVMPLYNAEAYVACAVDSILAQTFGDFVFLVIDDGSTDGGPDIVRSYSDPRIILWGQENLGPAAAMNRAIRFAAAHGITYIARMDADDVSLPHRLEQQLAILRKDATLAACSANCHYIDAQSGNPLGTSRVAQAPWLVKLEIQCGLRGLIQPAAVFRTEMLATIGGYRESFRHAEDTDLFLRLSERYRLANCREYLHRLRLRGDSLSLHDVPRNSLYHLYALDCYARRRAHKPERLFEDFARSTGLLSRYDRWREPIVLNLWRRWLTHHDFLGIFLAVLLDPRRPIANIARRLF